MNTSSNLNTSYRLFVVRLALSVGALAAAIVLTVNVLVQQYAEASTHIQLGVLLITMVGAVGLFLILQGVFRNTTRQVARQNEELHQLYNQLEEAYDASLRALSNALDSRDNETGGHAERVTRYAMRLGEELGLSKEELEHLYRGALLHDIGKIGVPDRILRKPGRLDEREFNIMRAHVDIGDVIIRNIHFLGQAREVVRSHHERWDGSGYPLGLSGNTIPIGARIFALCDAYDAMTSDRPYSRKRSDAQAREEIQAQAGRQFDPKTVQAFMLIPVDDWVSLAMEPTSRAREEIRELVGAAVAV
jgi:putative nucleotidyltransferase with HDIG domain